MGHPVANPKLLLHQCNFKMKDLVKITEEPLDVAELTAAVTAPNTGATAVFVGTTRDNFEAGYIMSKTTIVAKDVHKSEFGSLGQNQKPNAN